MRLPLGLSVLITFLSLGFSAQAAERTYFIAADELVWDYAPSASVNPITAQPFTDAEKVYINGGDTRIGRSYIKAVYRAYADASFTTLKTRAADETRGIL